MSILITGITGQAGSELATQLIAEGVDVVGMIRRVSGDSTKRLSAIKDKIRLVEGDLTDISSVISILRKFKPSSVFNAAAQSHVHTSFEQPRLTWDITGQGVLNLLEAVRLTDSDCRIVQFSSSEMFGDQYDKKMDGNNVYLYQDENTRMNPQSPYAIAKLAGYNLIRLYRKSYGIFASNAILFNMESTTRPPTFVTRKITKYIGDLVRSNFSLPKLRLGNLRAERDWNFVGDSMKGVINIVQHSIPDDFVLATGETHSVEDFLKSAFSLIEIEDFTPFVQIDQSLIRPAEVPFLRGYPRKAKEELGWSSKTSFHELVDLMVKADLNTNE